MTEFSAPHEVTPAADPFEHVAGGGHQGARGGLGPTGERRAELSPDLSFRAGAAGGSDVGDGRVAQRAGRAGDVGEGGGDHEVAAPGQHRPSRARSRLATSTGTWWRCPSLQQSTAIERTRSAWSRAGRAPGCRTSGPPIAARPSQSRAPRERDKRPAWPSLLWPARAGARAAVRAGAQRSGGRRGEGVGEGGVAVAYWAHIRACCTPRPYSRRDDRH